MARVARLAAVNALVCAALAALFLAGLELYLRLTIPASSGGSIYQYTLETRRYKLMKPNAAVVAWGKELRTNDLGFRDGAPRLPPKRKDEFRIIVLGDSFTVSAGVEFDRIYTSLVQDILQKSFPEVRVVNLAVGGYNIVQYALVLEEVGLGLQPDLILVSVFPENDFSMYTYELNRRVASGRAPAALDESWYEALYVYRAYLGKVEARIRALIGARPIERRAQAGSGWEDNLAALRAIAEMARARNIPLAVAVLPSTWDFEKQQAVFERVERHCAQLRLACLNLLKPLMRANVSGASLRLNAVDAHPNENYNALVAVHLSPYLAALYGAIRGRNGEQALRATLQ